MKSADTGELLDGVNVTLTGCNYSATNLTESGKVMFDGAPATGSLSLALSKEGFESKTRLHAPRLRPIQHGPVENMTPGCTISLTSVKTGQPVPGPSGEYVLDTNTGYTVNASFTFDHLSSGMQNAKLDCGTTCQEVVDVYIDPATMKTYRTCQYDSNQDATYSISAFLGTGGTKLTDACRPYLKWSG